MTDIPFRAPRVAIRPGALAGALAVALGLALTPVALQAQDAAAPDKRLDPLRACAAIADGPARLACYDQAAGAFLAAADRGDMRVLDREDVQRTKRRLFGFALPDIGLFGGGDDEPALEMLDTTIASVRHLGGSDWAITTPEGGIWHIRNAPFKFRDPKVGDKVVFKRAALGSYFIRVNGQTGVKGNRVG